MSRKNLLNIKVYYSKRDKQYVVHDKEVDEFGYGKTLGEALNDYFTSLQDFKASSSKRKSRLSDEAKRALGVLEGIELGEIPRPQYNWTITYPYDTGTAGNVPFTYTCYSGN